MKNEEKIGKFLLDLYYTHTEDIDPYSKPHEMEEVLIGHLKELLEEE